MRAILGRIDGLGGEGEGGGGGRLAWVSARIQAEESKQRTWTDLFTRRSRILSPSSGTGMK